MLGVFAIAPLAFAEVYFRLLEPILFVGADTGKLTPRALRAQSLQYQPTVYARHILPAAPQRVAAWEGGEIAVNAKGYRGAEFTARKAAGRLRIMVYGGSAVFDLGADRGEDWPHLVERRLHALGRSDVEVLNAGIPGHASTDSVTRLLTEGHFLEPDVVLLYNAWNDIKYFTKSQPLLRDMEPLLLNPLLYYQGPLDRVLGETFATYLRLRQAYLKFRFAIGSEGATAAQRRRIEETLDLGAVLEDAPAGPYGITARGLRQYEMNLRSFVDIVRNLGARPVLMTQARLVDPANGAAERRRISYGYVGLDHAGLVQAFAATARIAARVARDKNVPLIDAAAAVPRDLAHFFDHVHLRPAGSRRLARRGAAALAPLLPRAASPPRTGS